jgi:hypothetical protein
MFFSQLRTSNKFRALYHAVSHLDGRKFLWGLAKPEIHWNVIGASFDSSIEMEMTPLLDSRVQTPEFSGRRWEMGCKRGWGPRMFSNRISVIDSSRDMRHFLNRSTAPACVSGALADRMPDLDWRRTYASLPIEPHRSFQVGRSIGEWTNRCQYLRGIKALEMWVGCYPKPRTTPRKAYFVDYQFYLDFIHQHAGASLWARWLLLYVLTCSCSLDDSERPRVPVFRMHLHYLQLRLQVRPHFPVLDERPTNASLAALVEVGRPYLKPPADAVTLTAPAPRKHLPTCCSQTSSNVFLRRCDCKPGECKC